jgi:hypothetical protein
MNKTGKELIARKKITERQKLIRTKVLLPYGFYFKVDEHSFDLKRVHPKTKVEKIIGHYSNLENLLNKVTQLVISEKGLILDLKEFITHWHNIQDELIHIIRDYKF